MSDIKNRLSSLVAINSPLIRLESIALNSQYYEQYKRILLDGKATDMAKCDKCDALLAIGKGTTPFKNHADRCKGKVDVQQTKLPFQPMQRRASAVQSARKKMLSAAVGMCSKDMRPFKCIESGGMRELLWTAVDMCASHGRLMLVDENVLPSAVTVQV